jgi:hypothetical protein
MNGSASITLMTLPSGADTIFAEYSGDGNFNPNINSTSSVVTIGMAAGVNATVALTSSAPNGAGLASPVTFTATVTGTGIAPTGTVTFLANGASLGNAVTLVGGIATLTTSTLPPGPNVITAQYSGDSMYNPANGGPINETIGTMPSGPTMTVLTSTAVAAVFGNPLTFTATINPLTMGGAIPTGSVTFTSGMTTFGPIAVGPNGTATLTTAALPAGMDAVTATYSGDLNYDTSVSAPINETIGTGPAAAVNFQLLSSTLAAAPGAPVTFTADVRPVVAGPVPTGNVIFYLNNAMGMVLGTQAVQNIGTAVLTLTTLPVGVDTIVAVYGGDSVYGGATSGPVTVSIGAPTGGQVTSITLKTSNASVPVGALVTFTATITPQMVGGALPTGTITFYNGSTSIGVVNVLNSMASLKIGNLPQGLDDITATYSGDLNYAPSTSNIVVETVGTITQTLTITNLVTSNPDVTIGGTALLTATVSAAGGNMIPTGVVSFIEGTATMGSANVQPDGTATFNLPALKAGVDQHIGSHHRNGRTGNARQHNHNPQRRVRNPWRARPIRFVYRRHRPRHRRWTASNRHGDLL